MESPPTDLDAPPAFFFDALDSFFPDETLTLALDSSSDSTKTIDKPSSNLSPPPSSVRLRRRRRSSTGGVDNSWSDREERRSTVTVDAAATGTDRAVSSSPDGADESVLVSAAGFLVSALFFQFNLIAAFSAAPFRLLHFAFSLVFDPFGTLSRSRNCVNERLFSVWNRLVGRISSVVGNQQDVGKLALRLALGCFWSAYVGFVLLWVLVTAFVGGGLLMRSVVEEPMHMVRDLSFDYTKPSPAALVQLDSQGGPAVLPGRRLQIVVSLTLPESDYNQKLGVFQVRVELLSRNGKVTYSSSQPCMLRFKSSYIRLIETFLKSGSLLAGYSSESQVIRIKMTGLVERTEPTVCIRVILEPRAEYRPGAGIPQIYSASLEVETDLPFLKRILWNWRRTVFIWVVIVLFVLEILIVLICCRPIIFPRTRPSSESPSRTQQ
ncbi:putative seipin-2 [Iris pallida]|uniref:Seipin-2 n=1 Tax=Iris pallida TaxID=29817 RepID=A0AAX6EE42_IRIPA|nr:putative seipin-2 [Iris pallida]